MIESSFPALFDDTYNNISAIDAELLYWRVIDPSGIGQGIRCLPAAFLLALYNAMENPDDQKIFKENVLESNVSWLAIEKRGGPILRKDERMKISSDAYGATLTKLNTLKINGGVELLRVLTEIRQGEESLEEEFKEKAGTGRQWAMNTAGVFK